MIFYIQWKCQVIHTNGWILFPIPYLLHWVLVHQQACLVEVEHHEVLLKNWSCTMWGGNSENHTFVFGTFFVALPCWFSWENVKNHGQMISNILDKKIWQFNSQKEMPCLYFLKTTHPLVQSLIVLNLEKWNNKLSGSKCFKLWILQSQYNTQLTWYTLQFVWDHNRLVIAEWWSLWHFLNVLNQKQMHLNKCLL